MVVRPQIRSKFEIQLFLLSYPLLRRGLSVTKNNNGEYCYCCLFVWIQCEYV